MTILGRSEGLVSRCVECDLAEPESLASLGGSAPGVVDGILSHISKIENNGEQRLLSIWSVTSGDQFCSPFNGYLPPLTKLAAQTEFSQLEKDCSSSSKDGHGL